MDIVLHTALAKALARDLPALAPGTYEVDAEITLRVHGTVRKGEDVEYTPTVEIPLLATLALVLEKSGFMREHAKAILVEAMTEAIRTPADAIANRLNDVHAAMAHVREVTDTLPKKIRAGAVTVRAAVTETAPVM